MTHTPTNVIQYNEYYPFGLQTGNSWTREDNSNNFQYNAGSELNENSGWYETFFRGYDAALGRFNQVDPVAFASSSLTPYNYGFNEPVFYNDPNGDYPPNTCCSGGGGGGYAIDSDLDFNGNPLPGYVPTGGGYSSGYGGGPGSGNHWSDPYRSTYGNWMLMSSTTFNSYYGITDQYGFTDEERKSQIASKMGSPAYWVTTDEGNFIYTDKSFQQLEGWYRAQYMGSGSAQQGSDYRWYEFFADHNPGGDFLYELNRFNPIAQIANSISAYTTTGKDTYGLRMSGVDATINLAAVIPIGRLAKGTIIIVEQGGKIIALTEGQAPKLFAEMRKQLAKPHLTPTVGKPFVGGVFEQTISGVPNKTGPMSFW